MTRRGSRALLWFAGAAAFLLAAAYAVGGPGLFRRMLQMRSRAAATIEATLQPPTQAEMERAARDTASVMPGTGPPPASIWLIAISIGAIILAAVVTFYVTGRRQRQP